MRLTRLTAAALALAAASLAMPAQAAGCLVWKRGPGGSRCIVPIGTLPGAH